MNKPKKTKYQIRSSEWQCIGEVAVALSMSAIDQAIHTYETSLPDYVRFALNGRMERGIEMAKANAVLPYPDSTHPRRFMVRSSDGSRYYIVDLDADSCDCPDHGKGHFCKHLIATHIFEIALKATSVTQPLKALVGENPVPSIPKVEAPVYVPESPQPIQAKPENRAVTQDSVIWAVIHYEGQSLGVEVVAFDGDQATIRALPKIVDGKKLQPQFPFLGKKSTTAVPKKELFHVTIFQ